MQISQLARPTLRRQCRSITSDTALRFTCPAWSSGRWRPHVEPSIIFCGKILQSSIVQHRVRQHALETIVLVLKRAQLLRVRHIHAAKLRFVFVESRTAPSRSLLCNNLPVKGSRCSLQSIHWIDCYTLQLRHSSCAFTPASYSLIIPMICSSLNLRFIVHPLLGRITNTSVA